MWSNLQDLTDKMNPSNTPRHSDHNNWRIGETLVIERKYGSLDPGVPRGHGGPDQVALCSV